MATSHGTSELWVWSAFRGERDGGRLGQSRESLQYLQEEQHLAGSMGGHSKSGVNMVGMETGTDMVCVCVCVCVYKELWQLSTVGIEHFVYTLPECMRIPGAWQPFKILNCQSFFFFFFFNCGHSTNVLSIFSHVWLCETLQTVACQAPLSNGILQARILEWVAMPSSRGSSPLREWTWISCIAGRFFTI